MCRLPAGQPLLAVNDRLLVQATAGPDPKRISKSISQLIISPLEQHSKKPDEVRKRIVELFGELPRIELFARQKTSGWDVWGNEVEGSASSRILENAGKGDGNRGICISTQRFDKGKK